MLRQSRLITAFASAAMMLGWMACGGESKDTGVNPLEKTEDSGTDSSPPVTYSSALMRPATSCDDLQLALREDARERLRIAMQGAIDSGMVDGGGSAPGDASWGGADAGGTTGTGSSTHSETNTQVAGVDEADFVKTDGVHIFLVRENELRVVLATPADQLANKVTVQIEGTPFEMFLIEDASTKQASQLLVYSHVEGKDVFEKAGVPLPSSDGSGPAVDGGFNGASAPMLVKATLMSVKDGVPTVASESYFDGAYNSSRRIDSQVTTLLQVSRRMPALRLNPTEADKNKAEMVVVGKLLKEGKDISSIPSDDLAAMVKEALGQVMVQENEKIIESISYKDWLPYAFIRKGDQIEASSVACEGFYVPKAGSTSVGITHIAPLNLDQPSVLQPGKAILGIAGSMYQNASKMVLANVVWDNTKQVTQLHSFDLSSGLSYQGSGIVDGSIYGQFAIDEKDGAYRVVTTERQAQTLNHLRILKLDQGELKVVGDTGPLAPNDRVYAVRYVGDTAYVVTSVEFKDPLYAIDLKDAEHPKVLGELQIPGFSEYMHPLDENHLLTVGRGEAFNSIVMRIFDVTDKTKPSAIHSYTFEHSGSTEISRNFKAFTYYADKQMLAVPYVSQFVDGYQYLAKSSLDLFKVTLDSGFTKLGAVDSTPLLSDAEKPGSEYYCDSWMATNLGKSNYRRGIFIDDALYAIAENGIVSVSPTAPGVPLSSVLFIDPTQVPFYCSKFTVIDAGQVWGSDGAAEAGDMDGGVWGSWDASADAPMGN